MKTKLLCTDLIIAICLAMTSTGYGKYPPDNAAILYNQAFACMNMDKDIAGKLSGITEPNETIIRSLEKYLASNEGRQVIKLLTDAGKIKNCDWGYDYSEGLEMLLPNLYPTRCASRLLIADARMLAKQRNYVLATQRLLSNYELAKNITDKLVLSFLVNLKIDESTTKEINSILGNLTKDELKTLKQEIAVVDAQKPKFIDAFNSEVNMLAEIMTTEKFAKDLLKDITTDKLYIERIKTADAKFWAANKAYCIAVADRMRTAFVLPYPEATAELKKITSDIEEDVKTNRNATMADMWYKPLFKVYDIDLRTNTKFKELKAAIDVAISK